MAKQRQSIDTLVRDYLISCGWDTEHGYERCLNYALKGLRELNFDVIQNIRSAEIAINSNTRSIELPYNYVNLIRVGICTNGRVEWITEDKNLCLPNANQHGDYEAGTATVPSTTSSNPPSYELDAPIYTNTGQSYGMGGGQNSKGYYRVDMENNVIYFSSDVTGPIQLEYITDDTSFTATEDDSSAGTTGIFHSVHQFAAEALESFIYWKDIQRQRKIPQNEKLAARAEFYNQKRLARARFHALNKDKILTTGRKAFKQAPKI